ncbi:MAG: hypothetical protein ACI9F9_002319 [Candidatus Paceibacteria bacterium]
MKKHKAVWIGILGGGALLAGGLGYLIFTIFGTLDQKRLESDGLRTKIAQSRKLIEGTSGLEREVIVQREMSVVISNILPDNEDMNNWVRVIQGFSDESGVQIRGFKKKPAQSRGKKESESAFDEVTYSFTIESDTFQLLEYFNMVETHKRFMRIPLFKVAAARREQVEETGLASHKVNLDIQTFVYEPPSEASTVKIEGYDRKRNLMVGEINRRRQDLVLASYTYRGARGRRDPFVDPRVPVEGGSVLTVPEQMEIVEGLVKDMENVSLIFAEVQASQNVIEEMMARADLEKALAMLQESVRRVEAEGAITYLPSQRRFQLEVVDALGELYIAMGNAQEPLGPSVEKLREVLEAMNRHFDFEEFDLALDAYALVSSQMDYIASDPIRKPFVERLRHKALVARIVLEFEDFDLDVRGISIMEGAPSVAHINGYSVSVGDMLEHDLIINEIRTNEIEFIYRGVVLARRF